MKAWPAQRDRGAASATACHTLTCTKGRPRPRALPDPAGAAASRRSPPCAGAPGRYGAASGARSAAGRQAGSDAGPPGVLGGPRGQEAWDFSGRFLGKARQPLPTPPPQSFRSPETLATGQVEQPQQETLWPLSARPQPRKEIFKVLKLKTCNQEYCM